MQIESSSKIKNILFIGSTGSGKSTTCNTISRLNPGPFIVGHEVSSCTSQLQEHICAEERIKIIDMPGFQDNTKAEKQIDQIFRQIILKLADPTGESTNNIDAFVLVCKLNPRPQTLKKDLERMRQIFGTVSLKSLILLVVKDPRQTGKNSEFLSELKGMHEIVKLIREGKEEQPHEGWFCTWDNLRPLEGQQEELIRKIERLEPYTYRKYLESEKEVKVLIDENLRKKMENEIARASKDHEKDQLLKKHYIQEIERKFAEERANILKATEDAHSEVRNFLTVVSRMKEEDTRKLREFYEQMSRQNEEREARTLEILSRNEDASRENMAELMEENRKLLDQQNQQLVQLLQQAQENEREEEEGGGEDFVQLIFGTITSAGTGMVKNLVAMGFGLLEKNLTEKCNIF